MFGGKDFLPKNDESQFEVSLRAPEGTTVEQTELITTRVSREVKRLPGVAYTIVLVGDDERRTANVGRVFVKLVPVPERRQAQFQIMDEVRTQVLPRFAADDLRTSVSQVAAIAGGGFTNKEVAFFVSGPDLRKLGEFSQRIAAALTISVDCRAVHHDDVKLAIVIAVEQSDTAAHGLDDVAFIGRRNVRGV